MSRKHKKHLMKSLLLAGALPLFTLSAYAEGETQSVAPESQNVPANADEDVASYSYLGVALDTLPAANYTKNSQPGVQVIYVLKNSPAAQAGLQVGDILLSLDGQKLFYPIQFSALVRSYKPGTEVKIVLLRNGEKIMKEAIIGERRIKSAQRQMPRTESSAKDDVRIYINGREVSLGDNSEQGGWISVTPNGILIRDRLDIPVEFRRIVKRAHEKLPDAQKVMTSLRQQYNDARKAALGKSRQTFSQVFFGQGNSVIVVGDENGRQVTVTRGGNDDVLFRGACTTQADIDAIPAEAKKIIDSFTVLQPMVQEEPPSPSEEPAPELVEEEFGEGEIVPVTH